MKLVTTQLKFQEIGSGHCQDEQCTLEPLSQQFLKVHRYILLQKDTSLSLLVWYHFIAK